MHVKFRRATPEVIREMMEKRKKAKAEMKKEKRQQQWTKNQQ
jgi:DNA polymerase elongation subunit (family B)